MKRPEHIIEDLITRQLDGTPLTDTERRELQEWLEASEANRDAFLRAYKAWGNARLAETRFNTGQALENVMARIAEASRPRSFLRPQLRRLGIGIAAAACVMLAVVGYYRLQPSTVPDIEMFIRQADTPVFTQKEVQLVLSEQKTLLLETQKSTIRYDSTAIRINNAEKTIPKKEAATFNQLVVPYGKQTTLTEPASGSTPDHGWSTPSYSKSRSAKYTSKAKSTWKWRTMPNGLSRYTQAKWMSAFWEPNSTYPPTAAIARRRSSCSPAPSA